MMTYKCYQGKVKCGPLISDTGDENPTPQRTQTGEGERCSGQAPARPSILIYLKLNFTAATATTVTPAHTTAGVVSLNSQPRIRSAPGDKCRQGLLL